MKKIWKRPGGCSPALCQDMQQQPHVLIAGATGSGKSVLINSFIYSVLGYAPCEKQLVLIDPKRVELIKYKNLPHTRQYASEYADMIQAIRNCVDWMESRYKAMQKAGIVKTDEPEIFIVIDEFADLMTTCKKETLPPLCRIAQLGRAANIHLVLATQRPTRDIINGQIKVNIDCRVALRCPSQRDSINVIDCKGAESLPKYGYGLYRTADSLNTVEILKTDDGAIADRITWWMDQAAPWYKKLIR